MADMLALSKTVLFGILRIGWCFLHIYIAYRVIESCIKLVL